MVIHFMWSVGRWKAYSSLIPNLGWLWRRNCRRSRVILDLGEGTVENLVFNLLRFYVGYPCCVVAWTSENLRNWLILAPPVDGVAGCYLAFPLSAPPFPSGPFIHTPVYTFLPWKDVENIVKYIKFSVVFSKQDTCLFVHYV